MPFKTGLTKIYAVLAALMFGAVPLPAREPALRILPAHPRQGDALFIRLEDPDAVSPEVLWRNRRFSLYLQGEIWLGSVPVSPDTPAGAQTLRVRFVRGSRSERMGDMEELRVTVHIARVNYPVQRLQMPRRTERLYHYPGVEKEERAIGGAIRVRSRERLWQGDWSLPANGRPSTPFGVRRIRNGRFVGRHRGTDMAAPEGTPVMAPAAGRVVLADSFKKHGKTVVLDHGMGITSLYLHMSALHVRAGQRVPRDTRLGNVGSTGVATGPHLHWAVYVQGEPVDPLFFHRLSRRGVDL